MLSNEDVRVDGQLAVEEPFLGEAVLGDQDAVVPGAGAEEGAHVDVRGERVVAGEEAVVGGIPEGHPGECGLGGRGGEEEDEVAVGEAEVEDAEEVAYGAVEGLVGVEAAVGAVVGAVAMRAGEEVACDAADGAGSPG